MKLNTVRDSSDRIATRYALDVPGIEFCWDVIFRTRSDPVSCTTVTGVSAGGLSCRDVPLTTYPNLAPSLKKA